MALFIISYDLHKVRDYGPLLQVLRDIGAVRALESLWLLNIANTAAVLRDALKNAVDADDSILVVELKPGSDWASRLPNQGANEWLQRYVAS